MSEQKNTSVTSMLGSEPLMPEWLLTADNKQELVADDNRNAPGALRGDVTVKLHTREVYRLFTGLDPRTHERTKSARASLFSFEKVCQTIEFAVQNDDPYADYYFYHLHQRISKTHGNLKAELTQFSEWLRHKLPDNIDYSESTSTSPTVLPVRARTKLFFLALYLAVDVDKYCRLVYLACHFALIPKSQQNQLIHDKLNAVRSITEEANKFRHTDAIRDDFAGNNARARAAIDRHGFVLKEEFLRGETRSTLAPEITRRPELDEQAKKVVDSDIKRVTEDPLLQLPGDSSPNGSVPLATSAAEQSPHKNTNSTPLQQGHDAQPNLIVNGETEANQTEKMGDNSEQTVQENQ